MYFKQFYLGCLAHASYLIGSNGEAAVVDPQRDVDEYIAEAEAHGLEIKYVVETHLHADFVSGHQELAARTGAQIIFGKKANATFAHRAVRDGEEIKLGKVVLRFVETPGHTPEGICVLLIDTEISDQPQKILTGDTLFIGDVGRPDLRAALGWSATDLGSMLYDSLQSKLLPLPDASLVYPAHGAGSLCGRAISKETVSTIGEQRRLNYALQPMSKEAFIQLVTADQPEAPPYFVYDAVLNSKERPTLDQTLERELKALDLGAVLELKAAGAQILDVREPEEFATAHLAGSINIGLSGQYATWAGTVLSREKPIVIVANPGRESEAALRLGRIGFDHVSGYLKDGMRSLDARPDLTVTTERFSAPLAYEMLSSQPAPLLVDVRTPREREQKFIAGSVSIPLNRLSDEARQLPKDRLLLLYCAGGYRSSVAASILEREGFAPVGQIAGGLAAWESAKLPVQSA